jgi:hypothetical protein
VHDVGREDGGSGGSIVRGHEAVRIDRGVVGVVRGSQVGRRVCRSRTRVRGVSRSWTGRRVWVGVSGAKSIVTSRMRGRMVLAVGNRRRGSMGVRGSRTRARRVVVLILKCGRGGGAEGVQEGLVGVVEVMQATSCSLFPSPRTRGLRSLCGGEDCVNERSKVTSRLCTFNTEACPSWW